MAVPRFGGTVVLPAHISSIPVWDGLGGISYEEDLPEIGPLRSDLGDAIPIQAGYKAVFVGLEKICALLLGLSAHDAPLSPLGEDGLKPWNYLYFLPISVTVFYLHGCCYLNRVV